MTRFTPAPRVAVVRVLAAIGLVAAIALAAVGVGPLPPGVAGAQTPSPPADGSLTLSYQTPWVGASGDFSLRLHIDRPSGKSDPEVAVTIYPAVATRSEFTLTVDDKINPGPLLPVQSLPLTSLVPDAAGDVTVDLRLTERLSLGKEDGVFPVRVALRERSSSRVLQHLTTHIVYLPGQHTGAKLGLSLVLPVHAAPGLPPDGTRRLQGLDDLAAVSSGLEVLGTTPLTLAPTPETLATLAASTDDGKAFTTLEGLRQRAASATVLPATYVPTSLPALLSAGLTADATTQVVRGSDTIAQTLSVPPDARTWMAQGPLDDAAIAMLNQRGIDRVVVNEADLKPDSSQTLTPTQPFLLSGGERQLSAVVTDPGLAVHFDNRVSPALAASRLLADLTVIYLDQPGGDRRGVVAMAPPSWRVDRQLLATAVAGLNQNPVLEPIALDSLFGVALAKGGNSLTAVRRVASPPAGGLADMAADLRTTRVRLDALGSVLGPGTADHGNLDERLLLAESIELRTNRQRQAYLDAVLAGIDDQRQDIRIPGGRSFTLTARSADIPVTFQNRTGLPAKVVVRVQSDKLDFPQGSTQLIDLTRLNTTQRFAVVSRTSGAFPVRITLESPDGNLMIGQARLTVRSTAASGVGLAVSIGAAVFLAAWWCRHALRGRRARRLVPT